MYQRYKGFTFFVPSWYSLSFDFDLIFLKSLVIITDYHHFSANLCLDEELATLS
jgi:hypothetical protein